MATVTCVDCTIKFESDPPHGFKSRKDFLCQDCRGHNV